MEEKRKLGRNDPCWCGSGRLYKHCHRREDMAREKEEQKARGVERARQEVDRFAEEDADEGALEPSVQRILSQLVPSRAASRPTEPSDPETLLARFHAGLEAGELDAEDAFELSEQIRKSLLSGSQAGGRRRYAELLDRLRDRAPELYEHEAAYFTCNLIEDALAEERWEVLPGLLADMVSYPDLEVFYDHVPDALMYHGQVGVLRQSMEELWRRRESLAEEPSDWDGDMLTETLLLARFYEYMETARQPRPDDPALLQPSPYDKYNREWLERAILRLSAPEPLTWQPADFELVDADQWRSNLETLLFDFMADLRRDGVPLSRSHFFQVALHRVLGEQLGTPVLADKGSRKKKPRAGRQGRTTGSSLIPRRRLLESSLESNVGIFHVRPYQVAVLEIMPAYLHFLARVGAIHPRQMADALDDLQGLVSPVHGILRSSSDDPHLAEVLNQAWSHTALDALRSDPGLAEARAKPLAPPSRPERDRRPGALETMTFRVTYLWDREVWREIEMRRDQTLHHLHQAIQDAVNFDEDHLYSFFTSNRAWDRHTDYAGPGADGRWHADRMRVGDLGLRLKQRILYLFDYGDEHRFEVQLIAENPDAPRDDYPRIVARHGDSPSQYRWAADEDEEDWDDEDEGDWDDEDE